ncbi:hypothetical protein C8Q77DRAFT_1151557 [Trametes polyzona]|nr:hypothetical protein C8Q77DRAFT_1151557 [Trametes polyzona]
MPAKRTLDDVDTVHRDKMATTSNAPTRGRKRFRFDLDHATQSVAQGVEVQGFRLSAVKPGDEDGSFDCVITQANGAMKAALTILVSDASEYPSDHTFFCSSQHDLPTELSSLPESVYEDGPLTIQALLLRLLERIAKRMTAVERKRDSPEEDQSDDDAQSDEVTDDGEENYGMDDYDMDDVDLFGIQPASQTLERAILQREFNEIVAHGYQPGFLRLNVDDFALSVSMPAKSLADTIPPRALVAWDKRLLSGPQHFTLLVSGLRGVYPVVDANGALTPAAIARGVAPQFRVGLTPNYKPSKDDVSELLRMYGLREEYDVTPVKPEEQQTGALELEDDMHEDLFSEELELFHGDEEAEEEEEASEEPAKMPSFCPFSLSSSLESLLNDHFLSLLRLRIQYGLSWAGAEFLRWEIENTQRQAEDILAEKAEYIAWADSTDQVLSESYQLPADSLQERNPEDVVNLPLVAFSYLLRRLTLCPRYCLVCHQQLKDDLEALKPYVCSSPLCTYQYYNLNRGPSLEYEICTNTAVVDLLVSLAYIAAAEGALDAPLPIGMGIRVKARSQEIGAPDEMCDFDTLDLNTMLATIRNLIDQLPPIYVLKRHLEQPRKPGRAKPRLQDIDRTIPEAAWLILRWCVASCTAYLEELRSDDEKVKNMDPSWHQFRFSVGAPDAEAKFRKAVAFAQQENPRARQFPSLYAFHGSPAKNWHSIIRHGLWYKVIANGRAYGDGVYFAKDGMVSLGSYSTSSGTFWRNSELKVASCVALAEIVNLPSQFRSTNPYFVVSQTEWIVCRYLMVRSSLGGLESTRPSVGAVSFVPPVSRLALTASEVEEGVSEEELIRYVPLDPAHPLTLSQALIRIPEPGYALEKLLAARNQEFVPTVYDEDDLHIFAGEADGDDSTQPVEGDEAVTRQPDTDDWQHNRDWVDECTEHLMPPPVEFSPMATTSLQKELKGMLKEQKSAKSLRELGWYLPEELIGDNLYQWIVELHSFEESLPVAQDMKRHGINSLVFEIRFPPTFPHAPPFFRILKPRFLPFIQGGGGHVTGGGSMCMDLLTADGWLPSYSISAVLLQIKLAISNLEPRPARLAHNWSTPYGMYEALEGFKRAAAHHGWKVPDGLDRLTR